MPRRSPAAPVASAVHPGVLRTAGPLLLLAVVALTARAGFPQDSAGREATGAVEATGADEATGPDADGRAGAARKGKSARAADAVAASYRSGELTELKSLAAKQDPDPWSVVNELLGRGDQDVAEAYAAAASGTDVATLKAYVAGRHGKPTDPDARQACAEGEAALRAKDYARALAVYGTARASSVPILASYGSRGVALALEGTGRRLEALPVFVESADRAAAIGWVRRVPIVLLDAADCADDLGDTPASLAIRERIVQVQSARGATRALASALWNVGFLYGSLRQHDRALRCFERSREALVSVGSVWGEARMLQAEGECLRALGRVAESHASHERAILLFDKVGGASTRARCRAVAANALHDLGRTDDAIAMLERAAVLHVEGDDRANACGVLVQIAIMRKELGDWDGFADSLRRAQDVYPSAKNFNAMGNLYMQQGVLQAHLGDFASALACEERALDRELRARKRGGIREVMRLARGVLRDCGNPDVAVAFHERARALAIEFRDARLEVDALGGIAAAHLAAGRTDDAAQAARAAVERMAGLPEPLGEEQWGGLRWEFQEALAAGAVASVQQGDAAALCMFLEAGRATALLRSMRAQTAQAVPVPEDLRVAEAATRSAEAAAVEALRAAVEAGDSESAEGRVADARARLDDARHDALDVVERIRRTTPAHGGSDAIDTLVALRARLSPGEAFVSYGMATASGIDAAFALVLTRETERIVQLGRATDVEKACAALAGGDSSHDPTAAAAALRKLIVDPLGLDATVTRLIASPDGAVAFASAALLFPGRDVAFVPSGTAHGILHERAKLKGTGVLALGDPDYDTGDAGASVVTSLRGSVVLGRLPATGPEARAVGDVVLTRRAASEPGLRDALATRPRWHAVHIACHGLTDARNPLFSSLALTPTPGDDGFLTALEVHRMHVSADLVTLSACETGVGRLYAGEGSVGLAQAFMVAGAPRVLVSLWKVDDAATGALMTRFYEAFRKGVPAARALREAQESIRADAKWAHPRFWAAWVLWGDGG